MAPFYGVRCQGARLREAVDGAAVLVGVNVVRPVGRSTLTPPARRRDGRLFPEPRGWVVVLGAGSVAGAGSGCGLSEVPMSGVRSAALD
jgi:hypothetical protein